MKARIILTLALMAMIFLGCSKNSLVDPINETQDLEKNQPNLTSKAATTQPFSIIGNGTLAIVESLECDEGLANVQMRGKSKIKNLGMVKTLMKNCTDYNNKNFIKGVHTFGNGNQLNFYSDESGIDRNGRFHVIIYYGGTGKFKNAIGKIKLYCTENYVGPLKGTYSNYGKGTLTY